MRVRDARLFFITEMRRRKEILRRVDISLFREGGGLTVRKQGQP